MYDALDLRDVLDDEVNQRIETGFDLGDLPDAVREAIDRADGPSDPGLEDLLRRLEASPRRAGWPFHAVDDAGALAAGVPELVRRPALPGAAALDKIHGAWLGRCVGCLLGKPVEGWTGAEVRHYLERSDAWPLLDYIPAVDPHPAWAPAFKPAWPESTRRRISGMPRDDDLDYTIVCLLVMERTGGSPTADDVADEWLRRLPVMQIFTAERAAYRNLVLGIRPPASALTRNPYREWIGALIRADAYAYVNPGDPAAAARMAATDASVSHTGDGVSAAMWAAAVISMALAGVAPAESVPSALAVVPANTRLHAALELVLELRGSGCPWEEARDRIAESNSAYGWVHAIPNAATIAASLLWGEGDFDRSIGLVVSAGGDTDSTGATVGSAAGALVGASDLRSGWVDPLQDTLRTAVAGLDRLRISDLAARTHRIGQARAGASAA